MTPTWFMQGLAMILLGSGGLGASKVAISFDLPFVAAGYSLAAVVLLVAGILRLVKSY